MSFESLLVIGTGAIEVETCGNFLLIGGVGLDSYPLIMHHAHYHHHGHHQIIFVDHLLCIQETRQAFHNYHIKLVILMLSFILGWEN